ncbi:hypothetical protein D7Y41_02840 [Anaerotruncus sp. 1XD22-93]|nr:hypothetical protein [Lachnospiraceae bacterium]NBI74200.1 hypothetical protein [Lachnospiraceae bacterium]RKK00411.1 hypothetical protein D7Y41_02840 [Anaerotruncus sp. 1XD22-93]
METDLFLQQCNSAMGFPAADETTVGADDMDLMDYFGILEDDLDDGFTEAKDSGLQSSALGEVYDSIACVPSKGYSITSVYIENSAQENKGAETAISDFDSLTELEIDFFGWAVSVLGTSVTAMAHQTFKEFVVEVYKLLYPDKDFQGTDYALYDYVCSRYGANVSYAVFKENAQNPMALLRNLAHPYRRVSGEEVGVIRKHCMCSYFNPEDVYACSLEPRDTEMICTLQERGSFNRNEALLYCSDYDTLYFYLLLSINGAYNAAEYRQCVSIGTCNAYAMGKLNNDPGVTDALSRRSDWVECEKYLSSVSPELVTKYCKAEYLAPLLKFASIYGVNIELVEMYFLKKSPLSERLISCLDDRKFMSEVCQNPVTFPTKLLEKYCNSVGISIADCDIGNDFAWQLMTMFASSDITLEDVLLYLIINQQGNALSDFLKEHGITGKCSFFIAEYVSGLIGKQGFALPSISAPFLYQFRSGGSSMVFNVYEFINHVEYYSARIKKYAMTSQVISCNQIRDIGYCINFGKDTTLFKRMQERDKKYHCSLQVWLSTAKKPKYVVTTSTVLRYNLQVLEEVLPEEIRDFCLKILQALGNVDSKKYASYDLVLNYLYYKQGYCVAMTQRNFPRIVFSLMNAILMDNDFDVTVCFLYTLFNNLFPGKVKSSFITQEIMRNEPIIVIQRNHNDIAEFNDRVLFISSFDRVIKCIPETDVKDVILRKTGQKLTVDICSS